MVEESRYADPTPDQVDEPFPVGPVTLIYEVGDLAIGDSFSFSTNLLPLVPDDYELDSYAAFEDGIGQGFSMSDSHGQEVGLLP